MEIILKVLLLIFTFYLAGLSSIFLLKKLSKLNIINLIIFSIFFFFTYIILLSFGLLITGLFNLNNLTILIVLISICSIFVTYKVRPQLTLKNFEISKIDLLVLIGITLFLIPTGLKMSEWETAGMDAGNYVSISNNFINSESFRSPMNYSTNDFECLKGFECLSDGYYNPQYLPAYPILLADGLTISKSFGELAIQLVIAFSTLLAFYALLKKIFKQNIAIIALLIFMLMPLQILYSKEFMSENLGQFFFFVSMLFLYIGIEKKSKVVVYLSFIATSMMLLTKLDSILIIIPLSLIISFYYLKNVKDSLFRFTSIPLIVVVLFYNFISLNYSSHPITRHPIISPTALIILIFVLFCFVISFINFNSKVLLKAVDFLKINFRKIFFLLLLSIGVILLIRLISALQNPENLAKTYDQVNILRLTYFTSIPFAVSAVIGSILLIFKAKTKLLLAIFPFILVTCFTLYYSQHSSPLYWWGRRYLLFAIPLIVILTSYLISVLIKSKFKVFTVLIFLLMILYLFTQFSLPAFRYKQNESVNRQMELYASEINHPSIFLLRDRNTANIRIASVAWIYGDELRYFSDNKPLTTEKIKDIVNANQDKTIYAINFNEQDKKLVKESEFNLKDCFNETISYSYYFSDKILCDNEYLCSWNNALTTHLARYHLNTCSIGY